MPTKKITKKVVKRVTKPKDLPYSASLKLLGQLYKSQGKTIKETLENFKINGTVKGVGIMTISKGDMVRTKIIPPPYIFRLFVGSRIMREIALKQVSGLFNF